MNTVCGLITASTSPQKTPAPAPYSRPMTPFPGCATLPIGATITPRIRNPYLGQVDLRDIVRTSDGFRFLSLGCTAMGQTPAIWG